MKTTIVKFAFILFFVNLVAASILAGTYNLTKARIQKEENMIQEEALKQVMPDTIGDRTELVKKSDTIKYWKVFKGNDPEPVGYIYVAEKYGYSSVIETMVGIKKDGTITGVRVLSQNETPGLGARIVEIVSTRTLFNSIKEIFSRQKRPVEMLSPYFTEQFTNRNIKGIELSKDNIRAITGATISSRAVLKSIKSQGLEILKDQNE